MKGALIVSVTSSTISIQLESAWHQSSLHSPHGFLFQQMTQKEDCISWSSTGISRTVKSCKRQSTTVGPTSIPDLWGLERGLVRAASSTHGVSRLSWPWWPWLSFVEVSAKECSWASAHSWARKSFNEWATSAALTGNPKCTGCWVFVSQTDDEDRKQKKDDEKNEEGERRGKRKRRKKGHEVVTNVMKRSFVFSSSISFNWRKIFSCCIEDDTASTTEPTHGRNDKVAADWRSGRCLWQHSAPPPWGPLPGNAAALGRTPNSCSPAPSCGRFHYRPWESSQVVIYSVFETG